MHLKELAENILFSGEWIHKLSLELIANGSPELSFIDQCSNPFQRSIPLFPARLKNCQPGKKRIKFPADQALRDNTSKAIALHFFANHELLAIELMAWMIYNMPLQNLQDRQLMASLWATMREEQEHFDLYRTRLHQLGYDFGDFPLNGYFWSFAEKLTSWDQYFSLMSLTFEAANLDFSHYYARCFEDIGDFSSAQIMSKIYEDEINHVRTGAHWLGRRKPVDQSLWDYYCGSLPLPVTAARSKGKGFNLEHRKKANLPDDFLVSLNNYDDGFAVTKRKGQG